MTAPHETPPPVTVATRRNRAGTVLVRATDQGMPVEIRIAPEELRYGAGPLAEEILRLTREAATEAGRYRRDLLAAIGVPATVLDQLGLPKRRDTPIADPTTSATPLAWLDRA